jgi:GT2 family glycosyltransferase
MTSIACVGVAIPTYNRGIAVLSTLARVCSCDPMPAEIWVHVDAEEGSLEARLKAEFPSVNILTSPARLGPGGARHRCLLTCKSPYVVSFDDDSYPVDGDFFGKVVELFSRLPRAAVVGATIWDRHQNILPRTEKLILVPSYTGCGYAIRLSAYREIRGYLPRPIAYGMEETDVALQFFAAGWEIYHAGSLRVFHDTDLAHHDSPEIVSGYIANVGLFAFLHYPVIRWYQGLLQVLSVVVFSFRMGRIRGIGSGLYLIALDCYNNRHHRKPIAWETVRRFLQFRRTDAESKLWLLGADDH